MGEECRDFSVLFSPPLNSPLEAIKSIYRGIKGYLQNHAFPRKWGSLFHPLCKINQWGSAGEQYKTHLRQKGRRGREKKFKSLPYLMDRKGILASLPNPFMVTHSKTAFWNLKGTSKGNYSRYLLCSYAFRTQFMKHTHLYIFANYNELLYIISYPQNSV